MLKNFTRTTNIFAKCSGNVIQVCCLMRRKFGLWNMKVSWLGSDIISSEHPLFLRKQISTENVKGFIFMKVMKVIYTYKYLFQSFFFSRQTFFIFLSYSEKIIIYRSYFHILCFHGQRKLKNLPSPWNISNQATKFGRSISKQTVCFLWEFCTNYVLLV